MLIREKKKKTMTQGSPHEKSPNWKKTSERRKNRRKITRKIISYDPKEKGRIRFQGWK